MRQVELDFAEGIGVAERLSNRRGLAFLDSAAPSAELGRWSFLGVDPFAFFTVRGGVAFWNGEALEGPPLDRLRQILARLSLERTARPAPFTGGAIGFVAYDFGRRLERLEEPAIEADGDEMRFGFFDLVFAFDHVEGRSWLFSSGLPEAGGNAREERAGARMREALGWLEDGSPGTGAGNARAAGPWTSNFTADRYAAAVERVKDLIRAGDIYQANISQRFEAALPSGFDAFGFYRALRRVNPAPFAAFLDLGHGRAIASSSPERFLLCRNGAVETRPIKGTAARAADPAEDAARAAALAASQKDRAENVMIVDLLRNDLSRVCRPGTVAVPVLCRLETYASVHHLVSVVTGGLREGASAVDLLEAAFPGGSITGAPKLRAMDVVTEIEGRGRGVYCGAIGYIAFDGDMDLNVAIRTVAIEPGRASFGAGGGVTLLSEGEGEYRETLAKAERIFQAFRSFEAQGLG